VIIAKTEKDMMMKINKKREKALNLRIDQLNEQVCELIDELEDKDAEIKLLQDRNRSLEGQLEEKALELSACRSGNLMATDIIDTYIKLIRTNLPQELIEKCQEVAFANDASASEPFEVAALDDIISAVYSVTTKYFPNN
jgi:predicted  nucleic acid-binding Zn-ribbon protein